MAGKVGSQVKAFADKAKRRNEAIFRGSVQKVLEVASTPEAQGGRMPVDTGFLRNSKAASTSGMPGAGGPPPELLFATMEIGQTVWVGWTAAYARRMELGFFGPDSLGREYSQRGRAFLRAAVQLWPQIVAEETAQAQARFP